MNIKGLLIIMASGFLFSCSIFEGASPADFELSGTWEATGVDVGGGTLADITTVFTDTGFTGITAIQPPGSGTYPSEGELTGFDNDEDWYIAKITSSTTPSMIGKYGRTDYVLASDGLSYTGDSYSYESTEEAAKASTTVIMSGILCTKQ